MSWFPEMLHSLCSVTAYRKVIPWAKRWHDSACLLLGQVSVFQLPYEKKNLPKAMKYLSCLSHWAPRIS